MMSGGNLVLNKGMMSPRNCLSKIKMITVCCALCNIGTEKNKKQQQQNQ